MSEEKATTTKEWCELFINEVIHKYNPKFKLRLKKENKLFKLISKINPKFAKMTTTAFGAMWVSDTFFNRDFKRALKTTAHEGRHEYDKKRLPVLFFEIAYLFPQILFIPFLALAIFHTWWWLIPALIALAPLPAPGRLYFEIKGYSISRIWNVFVYKTHDDADNEHVASTLSSLKTYYIAWPFKRHIRKLMSKPMNISKDPYYKDVVNFLKKYNLS